MHAGCNIHTTSVRHRSRHDALFKSCYSTRALPRLHVCGYTALTPTGSALPHGGVLRVSLPSACNARLREASRARRRLEELGAENEALETDHQHCEPRAGYFCDWHQGVVLRIL